MRSPIAITWCHAVTNIVQYIRIRGADKIANRLITKLVKQNDQMHFLSIVYRYEVRVLSAITHTIYPLPKNFYISYAIVQRVLLSIFNSMRIKHLQWSKQTPPSVFFALISRTGNDDISFTNLPPPSPPPFFPLPSPK